eukprot:764568-Hanusia_phi.AAC.6
MLTLLLPTPAAVATPAMNFPLDGSSSMLLPTRTAPLSTSCVLPSPELPVESMHTASCDADVSPQLTSSRWPAPHFEHSTQLPLPPPPH